MELVVLNGDIARLVLDYLRSQTLDAAAYVLCKTSPYLKQEFLAYTKGLKTHSFFPELEVIICEYVKISNNVKEIWPEIFRNESDKLHQLKFSEKLTLSEKIDIILGQLKKLTDIQNNEQMSKDNSEKIAERKKTCGIKRSRIYSENYSTSEEFDSVIIERSETKENKSKRRRISNPYCFVNSNTTQHKKNMKENCVTPTANDDNNVLSKEKSRISNHGNDIEVFNEDPDNVLYLLKFQEPSTRSTPYKEKHVTNAMSATKNKIPILPEISQTLLDNTNFQLKLVENINHALNTSTKISTNNMHNEDDPCTSEKEGDQSIVTTGQQFENMIKNVIEATEKDPGFDAIIEEIIEASNSAPQKQSMAVQCNLPNNEVQVYCTSGDQLPLVSAQQLAAASLYSHGDLLNIPTLNAPPRTPLIIRTALSATVTNATTSFNNFEQMYVNSSFSSLIEPNLSVSKVVTQNSGDSALKNQDAQEEHCLNLAVNITDPCSALKEQNRATETDNQIYFDATTAQVTFPVFVTSDGLITNVPIIINNEISNQTIPPNNNSVPITADSENIGASAPKSAINDEAASSSMKNNDNETNVIRTEQTIINTSTDSFNNVLGSQDNVLPSDKLTPSTSGVLNIKACRSMSTPRRRAAHVRTLTFSPKIDKCISSLNTPLSTKQECRSYFQEALRKNKEHTNRDEYKVTPSDSSYTIPEKPIIKNIQIFPNVSTGNIIVRESSDSCTNQSICVSDENSNQTVITKPKLQNEIDKNINRTLSQSTEKSVTNSKRKSQPKSNKIPEKNNFNCGQTEMTQKFQTIKEDEKKQEKEVENVLKAKHKDYTNDKAMEEWKHLRSISNSDFDKHLRQINAENMHLTSKRPIFNKRKTRRRKIASIRIKEKELVAPAAKEHVSNEITMKKKDEEEQINKRENYKDLTNVENNSKNLSTISTIPETVREDPNKNNIAKDQKFSDVLLETPFKNTDLSGVPPTPGNFSTLSLETPYKPCNVSATYLFGSITKDMFDTPILNALTPGSNYMIIASKQETTTPRSDNVTEYSSGGSYYKPDEIEDFGGNIDKIAKENCNKEQTNRTMITNIETPVVQKNVEHELEVPKKVDVEVEISAETLKVEPIILERIKTFTHEKSNETPIDKLIDPHYTLADGLPEISAIEDSSSSTNSSSSSSSSSMSSKSSSSSLSSSSKKQQICAVRSENLVDKHDAACSSNKVSRDLNSLSEISSAEDEDWRTEPFYKSDDEKSRLVSVDGEVRYPVRSWLTPNKKSNTNLITKKDLCRTDDDSIYNNKKPTPIKIMLPLKLSEKKNKHTKELEMKRERLKEKLKNDANNIQKKQRTNAPNITAALLATRAMYAKYDTGKKHDNSEHSMEVLTALNLSAKQNPVNLVQEKSLSSKTEPKSINKSTPRQNMFVSQKQTIISQRRGLSVEARPVTRSCKANKKIVSCKSNNSIPVTTAKKCTLSELATSKLLNRSKKTSDLFKEAPPCTPVRISPRLMKLKKIMKVENSGKVLNRNKCENKLKGKGLSKKSKKKKEFHEDDTDEFPKAPLIKPKIRLKAKNTMISTKSKNALNQVNLKTKHLIDPCISNISISKNNVQESNDTLQSYTFTTIDETDSQYCFFIQYKEENKILPSQILNSRDDLSNHKMLVAFDENEKHIWTVTNTICLLSQMPAQQQTNITSIVNSPESPSTIRNIPKKRKIYSSPLEEESIISSTSSTVKSNIINALPSGQIDVDKNRPETNTNTDDEKHKNLCESTNSSSSKSTHEAKKLQIADIESILSHIHGT